MASFLGGGGGWVASFGGGGGYWVASFLGGGGGGNISRNRYI